MTLRILTVDDDPHRHERIRREASAAGLGPVEFRERSGPASVTDDDIAWARLVFLDHDMCQRGVTRAGLLFVPDPKEPCPNPVERGSNHLDLHCGCPTGLDFVRRLTTGSPRPAVVVHTANAVAIDGMVAELSRAGFAAVKLPASAWGRVDWRGALRRALRVG